MRMSNCTAVMRLDGVDINAKRRRLLHRHAISPTIKLEPILALVQPSASRRARSGPAGMRFTRKPRGTAPGTIGPIHHNNARLRHFLDPAACPRAVACNRKLRWPGQADPRTGRSHSGRGLAAGGTYRAPQDWIDTANWVTTRIEKMLLCGSYRHEMCADSFSYSDPVSTWSDTSMAQMTEPSRSVSRILLPAAA